MKHFCTTLPLAASLSVALALALPAMAADEYNTTSGVTTSGHQLGMHGMDTVQLTTRHALAEGNAEFTAVHDGVAYYFSSETTKAMFESDPEAYLPQFGGFCAYAVALGKKFDGDPKYADIVDGKLYLFVNGDVFDVYKQKAGEYLAKAHDVWPEIQNTAVEEL